MPISSQQDLESAWLKKLVTLPIACEAMNLYGGRGFQLALQASRAANAPLYVASAGLGLLSAERRIPSYGLTVSGRGPESICARVHGHFNSGSWWHAIQGSPFATSLSRVLASEPTRPVVIALTQPYARMLASDLEALPDGAVARLRIIGVNLDSVLSSRLLSGLLPYDERLEAILPGTRADFPQRALVHFVSEGLLARPGADANSHRVWVESVLTGRSAPLRRERPRVSDEDVLVLIKRHLPQMAGIGRLLRVLRDEEGVACEQARFSRLYRVATGDRGIG
ncbi:hypothetical protein [Mesorhizobium sp. M1D.F.Ca.ET.043.01.1.1]|uniref:hypothetical protein n=1 Tax=Mesorhizobium sp. M1D.F.Ca.ET.043.01.1.1 TaxID=2493669 RepID=UPI000F74D5B1|nr:hypothetical protein [Mesorhizobium sp. M1D.F.Ca.ET.043.01.1.1]AZO73517.1 hypothetical protein EJ067_22115 [Mesorhizobium sp. M1D.F.Ca.ET.043.01.1.1]